MICRYFDKTVTSLVDKALSRSKRYTKIIVFGLLTSCAGPVISLYPPQNTYNSFKIYVVSHGWHTGIVLRRADVPQNQWPQLADFPRANYIEAK